MSISQLDSLVETLQWTGKLGTIDFFLVETGGDHVTFWFKNKKKTFNISVKAREVGNRIDVYPHKVSGLHNGNFSNDITLIAMTIKALQGAPSKISFKRTDYVKSRYAIHGIYIDDETCLKEMVDNGASE